MNNPNPFIPQGTLLDQRNKKRARAKFAILAFFACNILLVGPLVLLNGCRRSDTANTDNMPADTGTAPAVADTNTTPALPPVASTNTTNVAPVAVAPVQQPQMPAPATPAPSESEYVVVKGDTMAHIATDKKIKLTDLLKANPDVDPKKMKLGTKLKIPGSSMDSGTAVAATDSGDMYTIKPGDNLTLIAHNHHTTVKELMALNNMKSTALKAGAKLKLPAGAATTSSPMETTPASTPTTTASNPTPDAPVVR